MAEDQTLVDKLIEALSQGDIPEPLCPRADALIRRMKRPTQVTLVGPKGVGKTGVLNLLLGSDVLPFDVPHGTVQLRYGQNDQTNLTLADGSNIAMDARVDFAALAQHTPVMVRSALPLQALSRFSLMEVSLPNSIDPARRALKWALQKTDVVIWCTEAHYDREQLLWSETPDPYKRCAILLRPRSDLLGDWRDDAVAAFARTVGNDFAYVLHVSALEAGAARQSANVDREKLRASGAIKLISAVSKAIDASRASVEDEIQRLLQSIEPAETLEDAVQIVPPVDPAPAPSPAVQKVGLKRVPPPARVPPRKQASTPLPPTLRSALRASVQRLGDCGVRLQRIDPNEVEDILELSGETLSWLAEHLSDDALPVHPRLKVFQNQAQDGEALVQLLQVEGDDAGAVDAVSAMLQIKRGMQAALAA